MPGFLDDLRAALKDGSFRPLPVRETLDPQAGRVREAPQARHPGDRGPGRPGGAEAGAGARSSRRTSSRASYGFRPKRRAQDAIAEIHLFGTRGYRWVLDADIEAAFDNRLALAVMDRVRARVKDKRVLALVKAFLKAGVLTELGEHRDTLTGTPQGGILSPLIFNIAMTALDEHVMAPWKQGGVMSTPSTGARPGAAAGLPTWRIVRYADDFVVLGARHARRTREALREEIAGVLAPLGLRLSEAKTRWCT